MKVVLDSRQIKPGEYFVPVKGDSFDGHIYIDSAIENGAVGILEVDELFRIAQEKLKKISPTVIAITGSVGKSTTKQYILDLLSVKFKTCDGYLNTKLGLATNIVNEMSDECEIFVAECGMDRKGELLETGKFISPDIVVLTNISESHMEKLGSIANIMDAKSELIQTIKADGVAFFNETNKYVVQIADRFPSLRQVRYGKQIEKIIEETNGDLPLHNKINLECAYKIAKHFGISDGKLISVLQNIHTPKGRLNKLIGINNSTIFDDTYNASPVSTSAALTFVSEYTAKNKLKRKIAILGGMLELGDSEDAGHKKIGDDIADLQYDVAVFVGDLSNKYLQSKKLENSSTRILKCENSTDLDNLIGVLNLKFFDVILVKGSQGIRMERAVEKLLVDPSKAKDLLVRQDIRWN